MKRNWSWLAPAAVVVCALVLAGCTAKQVALSDEEAYKRFVGTWVNTEYAGFGVEAQVTVIKPDYSGEDWPSPDSTGPSVQWTLRIKKTWVDEKAGTYCQYMTQRSPWAKNPGWWNAWLMRVDRAGKTIEFRWGSSSAAEETLVFPDKIDTGVPRNYWIYYRKK